LIELLAANSNSRNINVALLKEAVEMVGVIQVPKERAE